MTTLEFAGALLLFTLALTGIIFVIISVHIIFWKLILGGLFK
jgi:hypothetical protein